MSNPKHPSIVFPSVVQASDGFAASSWEIDDSALLSFLREEVIQSFMGFQLVRAHLKGFFLCMGRGFHRQCVHLLICGEGGPFGPLIRRANYHPRYPATFHCLRKDRRILSALHSFRTFRDVS